MSCPRCQGLVVRDEAWDILSSALQVERQARCVNCGWVLHEAIGFQVPDRPEIPVMKRGRRVSSLSSAQELAVTLKSPLVGARKPIILYAGDTV